MGAVEKGRDIEVAKLPLTVHILKCQCSNPGADCPHRIEEDNKCEPPFYHIFLTRFEQQGEKGESGEVSHGVGCCCIHQIKSMAGVDPQTLFKPVRPKDTLIREGEGEIKNPK